MVAFPVVFLVKAWSQPDAWTVTVAAEAAVWTRQTVRNAGVVSMVHTATPRFRKSG